MKFLVAISVVCTKGIKSLGYYVFFFLKLKGHFVRTLNSEHDDWDVSERLNRRGSFAFLSLERNFPASEWHKPYKHQSFKAKYI